MTASSPAGTRRRTILKILAILIVAWVSVSLYLGLGNGLARFYTHRARAHLERGEYQAGSELLEKAADWDQDHTPSKKLLAQLAVGRGEFERARTLLIELCAAAPTVEGLDLLARIERELKQIEAATTTLERIEKDGRAVRAVGLARLEPNNSVASLRDTLGIRALPEDAGSRPPLRGLSLLHLEDHLGEHGYGRASSVDSLIDGLKHGANAVSIRVPGRQLRVDDPRITFGNEPPGGETDFSAREAIRDAHALGYRVMLKPHIMLGQITDEEWRGTIQFEDASELEQWWKDYRRFILHYAQFSETEKVELFCIGVELRAMASSNPDRWTQLIQDVRKVYSGRLTYAANWYYEYSEVTFWSELDYIGVQFFFPLSDQANPTVEQLAAGLQSTREDLAQLATFFEKPVIFTEVGYKSTPGAVAQPWVWPQEGSRPDLALQKNAYQVVLDGFEGQPWFGGLFWWNWLTIPDPDKKFRHDFTPQGKPAAELIKKKWAP